MNLGMGVGETVVRILEIIKSHGNHGGLLLFYIKELNQSMPDQITERDSIWMAFWKLHSFDMPLGDLQLVLILLNYEQWSLHST